MNTSVLSLIPVLLLTGCTLFSSTKEITLNMEDSPRETAEFLEGLWTLEWSTLSGETGTRQLDWTDGVPPSFTADLPLDQDLLILLSPPALSPSCRLHPRGAFLPRYRFEADPTVRNGAAVSVLMTLTAQGYDMSEFNCDRFLLEMGDLDDPWLTDRELLVRQLGRQQMRSWYIRQESLFDVSVGLGPGSWFGPSLTRAAAVSESSAADETVLSLPEGWGFLFNPGSLEILEFRVDDHGEICSFTEPLLPAVSTQ